MSGRIDFTMNFKAGSTGQERDSDKELWVYIFGNFSGETAVPWQQRKIARIDIDSFDQVMAKIGPELEVTPDFKLKFQSTEDFHPDVWLTKIRILADLKTLKRELSNPNTAAQAAAKIKAFYQPETPADMVAPPQETSESQEDLLERLLGRRPEATVTTPKDTAAKLIESMISPYVTRDADPQHLSLINVIDATISQYLQALLHRPDFQKLEALWLATEALVNEEATDQQRFFLVDIAHNELLTELKMGGRDFEQKLLQHVQAGDGEQEVLLVADYGFSDSSDDKALLKLCSRLAKACDATFLGGAEHSLIKQAIFGDAEKVRDWTQYLNEIQADRVVLAYPRYLQRLPYGNKRNPIEAFGFEECSIIPQPEQLLWANPAFLCARAWVRSTQEMATADRFSFGDVPSFAYEQDSEQKLQPGTETVFTETQVNALLSQGITPLIGFRQRQGVRLATLSTLSERT